MTTRPWHRSAALLLTLPAILLTVLYSRAWWFSGHTEPAPGYLQHVIAQATPAYQIVGLTLVAVSGAAAGAAYRQTGLTDHPTARSQGLIVLNHLWPTLALGVVCWAAAAAISAAHAESPVWSLQPLPLIAAQLSMTLAWACVGYALGRSPLGPLGMIPAPFLAFFVFGFLEGLLPRGFTAMNGNDLYFCCGVARTTPPAVIVATIAGSIGLAMLALGLSFLATRRRRRWTAGVVAGAATFIGGAMLIGQTAPYPPEAARSGVLICESHGGTEVCLWPEQLTRLPEDGPPRLAQAKDSLRDAGVEVPQKVTADAQEDPLFAFTAITNTAEGAALELVLGMMNTGPACGPFNEHAKPELLQTYNVFGTWMVRTAGLDESTGVENFSESQREAWSRLLNEDERVQVGWANDTLAALHQCAPAAPPIPG